MPRETAAAWAGWANTSGRSSSTTRRPRSIARPASRCSRPASQIGKIYALAYLGRYAEALETGRWIGQVFEEHGRWRQIADLSLNLGMMLGRTGEDAEALAMFHRAREFYLRSGPEGEPSLALVDQDIAIVLRDLGRFDESIDASHKAYAALVRTRAAGGGRARAAVPGADVLRPGPLQRSTHDHG